MKKLCWAFFFCPLFAAAQGNGNIFLQNISWENILLKAKAENKYIFVDCYATWCSPCKWMDQNVYSDDTVGNAMKSRFLSIKIQMDTTQQDNDETKDWYPIAHLFCERYQVNLYPSYLFFSPDGRIVHKEVGALERKKFLTLVVMATDSGKQYYTLLAQYQHGDLSYGSMPYMVQIAKKLRQNQVETAIAESYIHQYLETLPCIQLWTKDNLNFIASNLKVIGSNDKIFREYCRDQMKIDSIMDLPGYSGKFINGIIYKEEISSKFDRAIETKSDLDWRKIEQAIKKKYGYRYVEKNILKGKIDFYQNTKEWKKYITYFIQWQEEVSIQTIRRESLNSTGTADFLNNCAWQVFQHSDRKKELDTAISWVNWALSMWPSPDPQTMDTKANLLYKIGRKSEGLKLEERCYSLATGNKGIEEALKKMKNGLPTWPSE